VDAFDADVLIYAAVPGHQLGRRVVDLLAKAESGRAGIGSAVLLPELLGKPLRDGDARAVQSLVTLLARLDLRPVDRSTATLAAILAARYHLRAADSIHLATAVAMGAQRFITNNSRDFPRTIAEIDITYPADLG